MSVYAISDLHLSLSCDKKMDVFNGWDNYVDRIRANWTRIIKEDDTVVIPGDISWALKLSESLEDFKFLESLPGKKIILKGNHDLWWPTLTKLTAFFEENNLRTITPLYNNAIVAENYAICGSRGWFYDESTGADKKVLLREAGRLDTSITAAESTGLIPAVFLHYPPAYENFCCDEIFEVLKKHGINKVFHGHIHGSGFHRSVKHYDGIDLNLISCDCIDFTPVPIYLH